MLLSLLALFSVLEIEKIKEIGRWNTMQNKTISDVEYRRDFFSREMLAEKDRLSNECIIFLENVENEVIY